MTMRTYAITGGATGIGAELKRQLVAAGHRVISVDIKEGDVVADLSTCNANAVCFVHWLHKSVDPRWIRKRKRTPGCGARMSACEFACSKPRRSSRSKKNSPCYLVWQRRRPATISPDCSH